MIRYTVVIFSNNFSNFRSMSRVVSKSLSLLQSGRRSIHVSAVSAAKQTMPDPIEHATGIVIRESWL